MDTILRNHMATLEPMTPDHAEELWPVDERVWEFFPNAPTKNVDDLRAWITERMASNDKVWLIRDAEGHAVGSTSLYNWDKTHATAAIGWTWLQPTHWRTGLNHAAKLLVLQHAFETLDLRRVEFRADARNTRSQAALKGIGATHEGTLRQSEILWDGHVRDACIFSILATEWPDVAKHLQRPTVAA